MAKKKCAMFLKKVELPLKHSKKHGNNPKKGVR
jgi:hypothetical protein